MHRVLEHLRALSHEYAQLAAELFARALDHCAQPVMVSQFQHWHTHVIYTQVAHARRYHVIYTHVQTMADYDM